MQFVDHCVMCGVKQVGDSPPPPDSKCLCRKCYKKVKREYERKHPDQKLMLKEIPEHKLPKIN